MKILGIFPIIFTALVGRSTRAVSFPFTSISISPLFIGRDSLIRVVANRKVMFQVYISNDLISDQVIASGTINSAGTYTYTYHNDYTRLNNELYIKYTTTLKPYESSHIQMNATNPSYVNLFDNENVVSDSTMCELTDRTTWYERHVTYGFENFDQTYYTDYYHKIRLQDFKIKVSNSDKPFFDCKPSLYLNNETGIFNGIGSGKTVLLALKLKEVSDGYTFELSEPLYVHKETLLLSKEKKDGFVQTKHIYLPRNEMRNQDQVKGYFGLEDFGIDCDFVKHNFDFRALKNIMGDCRNSQYCIQREYA